MSAYTVHYRSRDRLWEVRGLGGLCLDLAGSERAAHRSARYLERLFAREPRVRSSGSQRARAVLAWIDEIEKRPWLDEHFEEILVDERVAPGYVWMLAPMPLLPLDLDVLSSRV